MVTCITFSPNEDYFISGCLDKIIRVWEIKKKKVIDYINVQDLITSITNFPNGHLVAIGFHNGKVNFYETIVFQH